MLEMHADEESSFTELGNLMKKIKAVEYIARHHEDAITFHRRAGQNALQQAEKARTEVKVLRELYKGTISKFAVVFSAGDSSASPVMDGTEEKDQEKNREKHARVDSITESSFGEGALHSPQSNSTTEDNPKRTKQRSPKANDNDKSEIRTLHVSQTNAAFTLAGGHQNASCEYTSMSSSFVQRVAKRKESISALQSMNPSHQRTLSEPSRDVYSKPSKPEHSEDKVGVAEEDQAKAFL